MHNEMQKQLQLCQHMSSDRARADVDRSDRQKQQQSMRSIRLFRKNRLLPHMVIFKSLNKS